MADLSVRRPDDDEDVLAIATLRCRPCWQRGRDTRIVLQVPTWAKVGDYVAAHCIACIVAPEAPLLAEESGIYEVLTVKKVPASR